ncbi:antibiotic biosynthesis monooxygenase family protein [Paramicrobacterium agarici]|uniref:antibiotic biosynthesis monooxygenase family protein n=1 Tax=Paramicrobacterium agarici TaxID=630514 RepID=UPI001153B74B|nr:antibiotic biosynthesis monooxygenase [Microbacterium agarici]TQO23087.1 heme-degrading monooxygenase HmoA [Microbacterium agarici]
MAVVKINAVKVPDEAHAEFERRFINRARTIDDAPGFLGFEMLRPVAGDDRYFILTRWEDDESYEAWRDGDARAAHKGEQGRPVFTEASVLEFQVVLDVDPKR